MIRPEIRSMNSANLAGGVASSSVLAEIAMQVGLTEGGGHDDIAAEVAISPGNPGAANRAGSLVEATYLWTPRVSL
jgi:hypothetical protein